MADENKTGGSISGSRPGRSARQELYQQTASPGWQMGGDVQYFDFGDRRLRGPGQFKIYEEMADDPAAGALVTLQENITRGLKWSVRSTGETPQHEEAAQFLESCMDDLNEPFADFAVKSASQAAQKGHRACETVYKERLGVQDADSNKASSKANDGKIGWAAFCEIPPDTIFRWEMDDHSRVLGLWQSAPPLNQQVRIDASRLLNFRMSPYKDGPIGRSMFRRAFRPWLAKRGLEDIERMAYERRMCGLPVIHAPPEVLSDDEGNPYAGLRESLKAIVRDMRMDDQSGVIFPLEYDSTGKKRFELELLSGGDTAGMDLGKPIDRYNNEIFRCSLADFLGLGQGNNSGGSYALHTDKSAIYLMGLKAVLSMVCDLINRIAVPRLFALNGMDLQFCPEIEHSPLEQVDVAQVCAGIQSLAAAGFQVVDTEVLGRIFEMWGLPKPEQQEQMPALPGMAAATMDPDTPPGRPIPAPKAAPQSPAPDSQKTEDADPSAQAK